jgi:hypothetical protein
LARVTARERRERAVVPDADRDGAGADSRHGARLSREGAGM